MPKSRESSKPRKPPKIDINKYYSYRVERTLASHTPILDIISSLEKVEKPEDCILIVEYSTMKIARKIFNQIHYSIAVKEYNKKMEDYNKKTEEMIKNIKQKELEKVKQEEFEKMDSTGKRFAMLEFD